MSEIDAEIIKILEPEFLKFVRICIKKEDINELVKDPACEGDDDVVYFFNVYIQCLLEHKLGVSLLYKRLTQRGYDSKKANKFIYKVLKLKHKNKYKLWTWNEMVEYDIEYDPEIKTTKYSID